MIAIPFVARGGDYSGDNEVNYGYWNKDGGGSRYLLVRPINLY